MATIVRWNPIREMAAMQSALDRVFDETWRGFRPTVAGNELPLDVYESDNAYVVVAAIPGLTADQINVRMQEDVLTISAEVPQRSVEDNFRSLLQERPFGKFARNVRLPQPVDSANVEATYENGVLTLTLPKAPEAQPRQIPVRANGHSNN